VFPRDIVCLRNMSINTLHKGDDDDNNNNNNNKHQGLDPLIRSVSKVTTTLSDVSSVFQLFSFLVACSSTISKGFGFVASFASVETSSVCIHLRILSSMPVICSSRRM